MTGNETKNHQYNYIILLDRINDSHWNNCTYLSDSQSERTIKCFGFRHFFDDTFMRQSLDCRQLNVHRSVTHSVTQNEKCFKFNKNGTFVDKFWKEECMLASYWIPLPQVSCNPALRIDYICLLPKWCFWIMLPEANASHVSFFVHDGPLFIV